VRTTRLRIAQQPQHYQTPRQQTSTPLSRSKQYWIEASHSRKSCLELRGSKGEMDKSISSVNTEDLLQYNRNTNENNRDKDLLRPRTRELEMMMSSAHKGNKPVVRTLVTDLVPSEIACFDNSPGRMRRTAV
jgi:hypothetical protein